MDHELTETIGLAPSVGSPGRAPMKLRLWGALTLGAALTVIAVSLMGQPALESGPLLALSVAVIAAEHRDRLFGDGTSVSGSLVVSLAAVVAFSRSAWLAGPMICSAVAGLYWPHIRTRALSRVAINAGSMSLAAGAAACAFRTLAPPTYVINVRLLLAGASALSAFWLVNSAILAVAVAALQSRSWLHVTLDLIRSDTALLPFAVCGLGCGYLFHATSAWVGWLALVATLAAADVLVIRDGLRRAKRHASAIAILLAAISLFGITALSSPGIDLALLAPVCCALLGVALFGRRSGLVHLVGLVCGVAAAVFVGGGDSLFATLAVGLTLCAGDCVRTRSQLILPMASADALAAIAVGSVGSLLFPGVSRSWVLMAIAVGLACGVAALLGWHIAMGLDLAAGLGRGVWRTVLDLIRTDVVAFALAAALGSLCGWAGRAGGAFTLAASLLGASMVLAGVAAWLSGSRTASASMLDDDVVLQDLVQSALLDLPASTLPDAL